MSARTDRLNRNRRVVRVLWRSTNKGRTWEPCNVYEGAPLSGGVIHGPDGYWPDGWGNWYRNEPPL